MIFNFLKEIVCTKKYNNKEKLLLFYKYCKYFRNFRRGLKENKLFLKLENQDNDFVEMLSKLSTEDYSLINKLFKKDVKKMLAKQNIKFKLDFLDWKDFIQIGQNFVYIENPIPGLWTTGKSTIFMPVIINKDNLFEVKFFSIPPLEIEIYNNGNCLKTIKLGKLSTSTINFTIPKNYIHEKITEIEFKTNKLWLPSTIIENKNNILIGIAIKSLSNKTK